mmetsp:Transcript_12396/g.46259  ORF Transcript_12396/g.46259 Transcript_12396/m.46259 type:complete len:206 (+) Transcript_12396:1374-1991(+)
MMAHISFNCCVILCVLPRKVITSTRSVYSLTCRLASNRRNSLRSSISSRSGIYFARSVKESADIFKEEGAMSASTGPIEGSAMSTSFASFASPSPFTAVVESSPFNKRASVLVNASASALAAIALASVSACFASKSSCASASVTTSDPACTEASLEIASRNARDSSAFEVAYSANCVRATSNRRLPSAASDSACALADSALSYRS